MKTSLIRLTVGACLFFAPVANGLAQEPSFALAGEGVRAGDVTRTMLQGLPSIERDIVFQTSKGERRGRYRGVLLRDVLRQAGAFADPDTHAALRHTLLVTGRDGYAVAFSVGELLADFGDKPVILALLVDGKPLPEDEGVRLVVEGDRRGARAVYDIVRIELR